MIGRSNLLTLLVGVLAAGISHYLGIVDLDYLNSKEYKILRSLESISSQPRENPLSRVAVGANACVDVIVNGVELLRALGVNPGESNDVSVVRSLEDLQRVFNYHWSRGAAGERHVDDGDLFSAMVDKALKLPHQQSSPGGNAALIALQLKARDPGLSVLLGAPVGPEMAKWTAGGIAVPNRCRVARDDFHLVMEWAGDDVWGEGGVSGDAPRTANRFITSGPAVKDPLWAFDPFMEQLATFDGQLVIISGLHLLSSLPRDVYEPKLASIAKKLASIPRNVPIHLELASVPEEAFAAKLASTLFPLVDSIGLNEQELMMLTNATNGPHKDAVVENGIPLSGGVALVVDILNHILDYTSNTARLTRIHFHCLVFHVLVTRGGKWTNSESAVALGSLTASRVACGGSNQVNVLNHRLAMPDYFSLTMGTDHRTAVGMLNPHSPVVKYSKGDHKFMIAPVLVCNNPGKTVGLGDAVSAAGLYRSQFNHEMTRQTEETELR